MFAIGVPYVLHWFLLDLIPVIGLFLLVVNYKIQDMSVEPIGTRSPPSDIGLLRSLVLRMLSLLTIPLVVMLLPALRLAPPASVPGDV